MIGFFNCHKFFFLVLMIAVLSDHCYLVRAVALYKFRVDGAFTLLKLAASCSSLSSILTEIISVFTEIHQMMRTSALQSNTWIFLHPSITWAIRSRNLSRSFIDVNHKAGMLPRYLTPPIRGSLRPASLISWPAKWPKGRLKTEPQDGFQRLLWVG